MAMSKLTRREVLGGLAAVGGSSLLSGCLSNQSVLNGDSPLSSSPSVAQPTPVGYSAATASVGSGGIGTIGPLFLGLSYGKTQMVKNYFDAGNANVVGLFNRLGSGILRIGGDSVDKSLWDPYGPANTYAHITRAEVDQLSGFLSGLATATNWKCLYGVNLAGDTTMQPHYRTTAVTGYTPPPATSPTLAASEIQYVQSKLGSTYLYGVEIGNEPDAYAHANHYYDGVTPAWDRAHFQTKWEQFRTTIYGSASGVMMTGSASGLGWGIPFSRDETSSKVSLLTDHYYAVAGTQGPSEADVKVGLTTCPDTTLQNNLKMMRESRDGVGQTASGIAYRLAECNSCSAGGYDGVTNAFGAALWALDFMYTCVLGGATGVNFQGGLGDAYSPIDDDGSGIVTHVWPVYYGMLLFKLAGQGTMVPITLSTGGTVNISGYAIKTATGYSIIAVNKDESTSLQFSTTMPGSVTTATAMQMTASGLWATGGFKIQNTNVGLDGTFNPNPVSYSVPISTDKQRITFFVPAASAVLIQTT